MYNVTGLYDKFRGPHMYWLSALTRMQKQREQEEREKGGAQSQCEKIDSLNLEENGLINLVHYEDAATATVKALTTGKC